MFRVNDDLSIYVTRGDMVAIGINAKTGDEVYQFARGDVVRFKVFERNGCHCVVLQKDFTVIEDCEKVSIVLESADTKIGEVISKPKDYWYEVEINPDTSPNTIIGYDDAGAKIFRLYPEGGDMQ